MLLDDVMSELDADRRELLASELRLGRAERDHDDRSRARARRDRAARTRLRISPGVDPAGGDRSVSRMPRADLSTRRSARVTAALAPATTLAHVSGGLGEAVGPGDRRRGAARRRARRRAHGRLRRGRVGAGAGTDGTRADRPAERGSWTATSVTRAALQDRLRAAPENSNDAVSGNRAAATVRRPEWPIFGRFCRDLGPRGALVRSPMCYPYGYTRTRPGRGPQRPGIRGFLTSSEGHWQQAATALKRSTEAAAA